MSALHLIMDAQACNQAEALALFNPDTPELDSMVELVLASDASAEWKRRILATVERVQDWNSSEATCERGAAGALDAQAPGSLRDTIGVRGAAQRLRPVLGGDIVTECRVLRELLADPRCGERVLRSRSLRGQLGRVQYERLVLLLDAPAVFA